LPKRVADEHAVPAGDDTSAENEALSGRLDEVLQTVRRIETELQC
jgi:hypothetical protein